jgi:hypothetical protein
MSSRRHHTRRMLSIWSPQYSACPLSLGTEAFHDIDSRVGLYNGGPRHTLIPITDFLVIDFHFPKFFVRARTAHTGSSVRSLRANPSPREIVV